MTGVLQRQRSCKRKWGGKAYCQMVDITPVPCRTPPTRSPHAPSSAPQNLLLHQDKRPTINTRRTGRGGGPPAFRCSVLKSACFCCNTAVEVCANPLTCIRQHEVPRTRHYSCQPEGREVRAKSSREEQLPINVRLGSVCLGTSLDAASSGSGQF